MKIDEIMKLTKDSINEPENDLKIIEIRLKNDNSASIDEDVNAISAKIMKISNVITDLNHQITEESRKLKDETVLRFEKGEKITNSKEAIGILEIDVSVIYLF